MSQNGISFTNASQVEALGNALESEFGKSFVITVAMYIYAYIHILIYAWLAGRKIQSCRDDLYM
jgi:hypothetical protein